MEPLLAWVTECLELTGRVAGRKMMGGMTLYCDGTVFAIIAGDELWFKADKISDGGMGRGGRRALHLSQR